MRKLVLIPSQSDYAAGFGNEVLTAQLDGGPSRTRAGFVGAVATINVSWDNLSLDASKYLLAFYRTATKRASEPFLIDLILDDPLPTEYTASLIGGSFQQVGVRGLALSYSAQLEARPNPTNTAADEAIMDAYENFGDNVGETFAALERLMNTTIPDTFPG